MYPFRFRLENSLAGSQPLQCNKPSILSGFRRLYRIKCEVHGPDISKVKHTQIIDVCEVLTKPIDKAQIIQDASVASCLCFGGGEVRLMAMLDKNAYQPGENIKLTISIDSSNCSVNFNSTSAQLATIMIFGSNALKIDVSKATRKYFGVTQGPAIQKGSKQFINFAVPIPHDVLVNSYCNTEKIGISTDLQFVLSSFLMKDTVFNVPITIYALPVQNEILSVHPTKVFHPTEINPEMFKPY